MPYPPPPYDDSILGTFQVGEAKVGASWAYPPGSGILLGATAPTVSISSPTVVPSAGLLLGAEPVVVRRGIDVAVGTAALGLAATAPSLVINSRIACEPAGIAFAVQPPDYVGRQYIIPHEECAVLELEEAVCI